MSKFTKEIDQCIKDTKAIIKKGRKHNGDFLDDLLDSIEFFREVCEGENNTILDRLIRDGRQFFRVDCATASNEHERRHQEIIRKAPCLYPRQTVINVPFNSSLKEPNQEVIVRIFDVFCDMYGANRVCLDAGLAKLYLSDYKETLDKQLNILTRNNHLCKIRGEASAESGQRYLIAKAPWLYYASPEDYVDIINKHEEQFQHYMHHVNNLASVAKNELALTKSILLAYNDAYRELNATLDMEKEKLKSKGRACAVGVVATAVMLMTDMPDTFQQILGSTTIAGAAVIIGGTNLKAVGMNNKNWVVWKWHQKTDKRKKKTNRSRHKGV